MSDLDLGAIKRRCDATWPAPWTARRFEIDCPCPNGDGCGDPHTCEEVEAPEAYPDGQCVVQIHVPGLESLARPTAEFVAHARTDIPALVAEVERLRGANGVYRDMLDAAELAASMACEFPPDHCECCGCRLAAEQRDVSNE